MAWKEFRGNVRASEAGNPVRSLRDSSYLAVVTRGLSADGGFLASAIWHLFRQGLGAGMFSASVQFSKPTEVSRQLPQVPSGNRRPHKPGVCASQPAPGPAIRRIGPGSLRHASSSISEFILWLHKHFFNLRVSNRNFRAGPSLTVHMPKGGLHASPGKFQSWRPPARTNFQSSRTMRD
jgi:hypothetical protein